MLVSNEARKIDEHEPDPALTLEALRIKHCIPTFVNVVHEELSDLKKLFTVIAYSTVVQSQRMNIKECHYQLSERYMNHVILIS